MTNEVYPEREHGEWFTDPAVRVLSLYDPTLPAPELRARLQREAYEIYKPLSLFRSVVEVSQYYGRLQAIKQLASTESMQTAMQLQLQAGQAFLAGGSVAIDAMYPLLPPQARQAMWDKTVTIPVPFIPEDEQSKSTTVMDSLDVMCQQIDELDIESMYGEYMQIGRALFADQPQQDELLRSYYRGLVVAFDAIGDAVDEQTSI